MCLINLSNDAVRDILGRHGHNLEKEMEMMNRAIEDAADFRGMMDKMQQVVMQNEADGRRDSVTSDRQPGENRAAYRAGIKLERREAKKVSV